VSRSISTSLNLGLITVLLAGCGPAIAGRIDDGTLTTRVKTALLYDPDLAVRRLGVVTVDGVVTLSGTVQSPDEAARAERLARNVPGVRAVRSDLIVRLPETALKPAA